MTTRRLALAAIVVLAALVCSTGAGAQSTRVYRVGVVLQGGPYVRAVDGLRDGLRRNRLAPCGLESSQ